MVADLNKLPNGISDFDTLRKEQRIYVDKTDLIYKIASNNAQPIIFSRPRRFGKSLLDYYALKDLLIRNFCILNSH